MAVREIDETEYLAKHRLAQLTAKVTGNPKARELFEKAIKIVEPDASTPYTEAKDEIRAELEAERQERLALQAAWEKKEAEREAADKTKAFAQSWEGQKSKLRAQGYTDAGIAEIEKLAEERSNPDLEAMSALFDRLHPPAPLASPSGYGGLGYVETNSEDNAAYEKLLQSQGNDSAAEQQLITAALTDVRNPQRRL